MTYNYVSDLLVELSKTPAIENIVIENGTYVVSEDYAIRRMNDIYGPGNWEIREVKFEDLKDEDNHSIGKVCFLTLGYLHPMSEKWLTTEGTAELGSLNEKDITRIAFLDAVKNLGNTFGRMLAFEPNKMEAA